MKAFLKFVAKWPGAVWMPDTDWEDRKGSFLFWTSFATAGYGAIAAFCGMSGIVTGTQTALGVLLLIHAGMFVPASLILRDMGLVRLREGAEPNRRLRKQALAASGFSTLCLFLVLNPHLR